MIDKFAFLCAKVVSEFRDLNHTSQAMISVPLIINGGADADAS